MARLSTTPLFSSAPFAADEDPAAAPAASRNACGARPWTLRRGVQNLVYVYAFGLVFLIFAVADLTDRPGQATLGAILLGLMAVMYLLSAWVADTSLAARWCYVVAFMLVVGSSSVVWGWQFANYGVYVAVMLAALIPWRQARIAIIAWAVVLVGISWLSHTWTPAYIALIGIGIGLAMGVGLESGRVSSRLRRAEQRVSVLAVAAERERIGRDLHDILGHSLTAISIKSGLAARLVDQDPAAARQQLDEIAEVARQALADVRSTASGFREVRVATELASARSVLLAAGIEAQVPSAVPALSDEVSELFGFVVREAVTNVVRHSDATSCTILVDADAVTVRDDGSGFAGPRAGSGLRNLAERVAAGGGRFEVESTPGAGTVVRVVLGRRVEAPATDQPAVLAG
jgi:two-component system sensor histidine kinase DesK